jgi:integration host factor subunit beta
MNRSTLIDELAARFVNLTRDDTEFAVDTILNALQDALALGHHIEIRRFGSFSITHRSAHIGRNPRSGESVAVPGKRTIRFKPGKALRVGVDKPSSAIKDRRGPPAEPDPPPC